MDNSSEILKEWQTSGASRSPDLNFMVSESKKLLTSLRQDSRKLLFHYIYYDSKLLATNPIFKHDQSF